MNRFEITNYTVVCHSSIPGSNVDKQDRWVRILKRFADSSSFLEKSHCY